MLHFLIIIILLMCLFYFIYYVRQYYKIEKRLEWMPAVPGYPIIGAALEFGDSSSMIYDLDRIMNQYGKLLYVNFMLEPYILCTDYDFLEYILGKQEVLNKAADYKFLHKWLGTGLLTSDGPKWKQRRKITTPAFHFSILEKFVEVFHKNLNILISELDQEVGKESIDIYPFINLYTLDIICETAMGVSVNAQKNKKSGYVKNVKEICRIQLARSYSVIKHNDLLYAFYPDFYKESDVVKALHAATYSVIDTRRKELSETKPDSNASESKNKKMAFLDILLQANIEGEPLSREDIREEVDTFMFEGHDTVTSALSFTLYLLAMHPEVQKRAVEEQKDIFEGNIDRNSTYNDLQAMKYLERVIKESLRLYPPVPMFGRVTNQDIKFKGNTIPKGVNITIPCYSILRDPDYFEDPDKFNPDRFEYNDGTRPYTYIPFSAGPRNCIGQKFAMLELKSTLSGILRNFEITSATSQHKMILVAEAVLKSKNGIRIKIAKRKW